MKVKSILLNKELATQYGLSLPNLCYLLYLYYQHFNGIYDKEKLEQLKLTGVNYFGKEYITVKGVDLVNSYLSKAFTEKQILKRDVTKLAESLIEIYPKGKKIGTTSFWSSGKSTIATRLSIFLNHFKEPFTDEDILNATKRYVKDFENNPYMRTLDYFILKGEVINGETVLKSDLYNYLTNQEEKVENYYNKLRI